MDSLLSWFIKSDFVKAQILAQTRHIVTALGAAAVAHGYADHSMVEAMMGFCTSAVGFYLANLDVKSVDGKIKVALNTPAEQIPADPSPQPDVKVSDAPQVQYPFAKHK